MVKNRRLATGKAEIVEDVIVLKIEAHDQIVARDPTTADQGLLATIQTPMDLHPKIGVQDQKGGHVQKEDLGLKTVDRVPSERLNRMQMRIRHLKVEQMQRANRSLLKRNLRKNLSQDLLVKVDRPRHPQPKNT